MLKKKGKNKINKDRRTGGEKAEIYEIHTYPGGPNTHLSANPGTDPKGMSFEPGTHRINNPLHSSAKLGH